MLINNTKYYCRKIKKNRKVIKIFIDNQNNHKNNGAVVE